MKNQSPDLYKILGISRTAPKSEIKKAYKRKAIQTHPDMPDGSVKSFALVKKAFDTLSDDVKRKRYDDTGDIDEGTPNNKFSDAVNVLAGVFNHVLQECAKAGRSPLEMDMVEMMKQTLDSSISEAGEQERVLKNVLATDKKLQGRFKKKTGANIMENIIKSRILELGQKLKVIEKNIGDQKEALNILSDFTFKWDEPERDERFNRLGFTFVNL